MGGAPFGAPPMFVRSVRPAQVPGMFSMRMMSVGFALVCVPEEFVVAAREPATAPGRIIAVSTEPLWRTPAPALIVLVAGAPGTFGLALKDAAAPPAFATANSYSSSVPSAGRFWYAVVSSNATSVQVAAGEVIGTSAVSAAYTSTAPS